MFCPCSFGKEIFRAEFARNCWLSSTGNIESKKINASQEVSENAELTPNLYQRSPFVQGEL